MYKCTCTNVHAYTYAPCGYAPCGYTRHLRTCRYEAIHVNRPSGISQAAAIAVNRTQAVKYGCIYVYFTKSVHTLHSVCIYYLLLYHICTRHQLYLFSLGGYTVLLPVHYASRLTEPPKSYGCQCLYKVKQTYQVHSHMKPHSHRLQLLFYLSEPSKWFLTHETVKGWFGSFVLLFIHVEL